MSESDAIDRTLMGPGTVDSLSRDLSSLGITEGMVVIVPSSLGSTGWVCGGAVGVVLALEQTLGIDGALVMPTHSGDLSASRLLMCQTVGGVWRVDSRRRR